ncbi:Undecaprenyl-phosphate 4-deoxy-4-formamido-L-arabinose transferase [Slackia heliotrinireducens]|nr:glycosyltransferase family 2 protein [Slackia heliotrinireducens]VEH00837.1 Undecaprenyl-phosphate 4-deoxy-4-formamido-L-arabinose transferase [Slackia heliotrinireducens]
MTCVSVVIPCYYSKDMIGKVVALTRAELTGAGYDYEFVLVNDGSTDGTFDVIRSLHEEDPKIIGVNLAKNFGQHNAIMAGLGRTTGDYVMLMDDDMQTHPSQCLKLVREMENGWDVVFAEFPEQHEAWWRRMGSAFTMWTMRTLQHRPKGVESSNFFVMRDYIAKEAAKYEGPYVYVQGILFRITHNMTNVPVEHFDRESGVSGYNLKSLVRLWSIVLNFSMAPLRAAAIVGAALGSIGLIGAIALIIRRLLDPTVAMGWSSLMVTMLVCSGAIIMFLGLIGEYLGRLFMTMNKAPQYVVKEVLDDKADHDE